MTTPRVLTAKTDAALFDLAERGGFAHAYADLLAADASDITPQQAFALAWYVMSESAPSLLVEAGLPTNKTDLARMLNVSRPTLYKWLSDERLAASGIARVVDTQLQRILWRGLGRMETIIVSDESNDSDAIRAWRAVAEYAGGRGDGGPDVQVNIDQRQQSVNIDLGELESDELRDLARIVSKLKPA